MQRFRRSPQRYRFQTAPQPALPPEVEALVAEFADQLVILSGHTKYRTYESAKAALREAAPDPQTYAIAVDQVARRGGL